MDLKEWKIISKQVDKRILKKIKPLVDNLVLEFDLNDHSVYGSIANLAHRFQYQKNTFATTDELKDLIKKKEELKSVYEVITDEQYTVKEQIQTLKREELKINKLFGSFDWQVRSQERLFGTITLDATDAKSSKKVREGLRDFFGSWGGSECIYMFDDGREISCYYNADDSDLFLSMDIEKISSKEFLEAFTELGIKISFDGIQVFIDGKKEQFEKFEALISEFKA